MKKIYSTTRSCLIHSVLLFSFCLRGPSLDTHQRLRLLHHCEHLFDYKPVKTSFCVLASCECLVSKVTVVFVCQYIGILAETNDCKYFESVTETCDLWGGKRAGNETSARNLIQNLGSADVTGSVEEDLILCFHTASPSKMLLSIVFQSILVTHTFSIHVLHFFLLHLIFILCTVTFQNTESKGFFQLKVNKKNPQRNQLPTVRL